MVHAQNISLHLKSVFKDDELSEDSVVNASLTTVANDKVSHTQTERATSARYLDYHQHRNQEEVCEADAELKTLENTLKKRRKT
jgi:hypothetical protein